MFEDMTNPQKIQERKIKRKKEGRLLKTKQKSSDYKMKITKSRKEFINLYQMLGYLGELTGRQGLLIQYLKTKKS